MHPEDFAVTERLGFEPDGEGEFALLRVRKVERDTAEVARALARAAGLPPRAVSWAGRKDRRAVAVQWFCLHLAGRPRESTGLLQGDGWSVLEACRHRRKLRVGALAGNRFALLLRDVEADGAALAARVRELAGSGVPNYFGPQRFGRGGANVVRALAPPRGRRSARSLALSGGRSALFNAVLAERVAAGTWNALLPGDVPMLRGSRSVFGPEVVTPELQARVAQGDIDPTGPLWGAGPLRTSADAGALEQAQGEALAPLAKALASAGLRQERRRLRLLPEGLALERVDCATWRLSFALEAGAFATSVVRELVTTVVGASAPA